MLSIYEYKFNLLKFKQLIKNIEIFRRVLKVRRLVSGAGRGKGTRDEMRELEKWRIRGRPNKSHAIGLKLMGGESLQVIQITIGRLVLAL